MKKTDRDEINGSVCIDCLMAIANDDISGIDDLLAWQLRVEMKNATDNGAYTVVPVGDTTYFSWSPCDYCASTLGGDRHDVVFIDNRRNK